MINCYAHSYSIDGKNTFISLFKCLAQAIFAFHVLNTVATLRVMYADTSLWLPAAKL